MFFFLLCVSVLCIKSTEGSYNNYAMLHHLLTNTNTQSQGSPELHRLHKRQSVSAMCAAVGFDALCTNGFYQELATVQLGCVEAADDAQTIQDNFCRLNSMGVRCIAYSVTELGRDLERACTASSPCGSECRDLLVRARSELGCCINNFYNDSMTPNLCGVELVTEGCQDVPFMLPAAPTQDVRSTCTDLPMLVHSINCRRAYLEDARNRLSATEGCQDLAAMYPPSRACNVNRQGTACEIIRGALDDSFMAASANCLNTSTCDPSCVQTLSNISTTFGCCFFDAFNVTDNLDWLSDEFWSRCGLDSPGLCDTVVLNDDPPYADPATTTDTQSDAQSAALFMKALNVPIAFVTAMAVTLFSAEST